MNRDDAGEHNIGSILAFIHGRKPGSSFIGPILLITGGQSFLAAFGEIGVDVGDIGECDKAMEPDEFTAGLLIFEGWVQWQDNGPDEGGGDFKVDGIWRRLDALELVRIQQGLPPWKQKATPTESAEAQA